MDALVNPSRLEGSLRAVPSKSLSHRALIAAACAEGLSTINNSLHSDDISATIQGLRALGATIDGAMVLGGLKKEGNVIIDANESGSTLRFLIPLALSTQAKVTFIGKGRLPDRPLSPYKEAFKTIKTFETPPNKTLPLTCEGPLASGNYYLAGDISSQFVSGLLFALPMVKGDSTIHLTSTLQSKSYVNLTLDVLAKFGIKVQPTKNGYTIKGQQRYRPSTIHIEGDYSQAAFFIVGGFLNGSVTIHDLHQDSKQGDYAIVPIMKAMGATIEHNKKHNTITVISNHRLPSVIDLADCPDLGPILMIAAAATQGETTFNHVKRLRFKESDRLSVMIDIVKRLGAEVTLNDDSLLIHGVKQFKGNQTFDSYHDHRIAMALSIAALHADMPLKITNIDCIKKSYPNFFEDYEALSGQVTFIKEGNERL